MFMKYIFILLYYVYHALSTSSFIKKDQRAELFELTDNEVPIINVFIPEDEFNLLKYKANNILIKHYNISLIQEKIKYTFVAFKKLNFTEIFPDYDINEFLPQLQIGKDGFAMYDVDKVFSGFDFNLDHYNKEDEESFSKNPYESNEHYNLNEIMNTLQQLIMSDNVKDNDIFNLLCDVEENLNKIKNKEDTDFSLSKFKTKNATLTFELNGIKNSFNKVTFSLGGNNSRYFSKPNYNLKIRGKDELYGRRYIKLRSDNCEPTYLRTKLVSDIHNRLGLKSISANYVQLYINKIFMGLYIITDSYKESWIEKVYGEKNTTTLYKCEKLKDFTLQYSHGCINENNKVRDETEWINFLKTVENAKSSSDLENIFEIDHFLYEMALEFLLFSYDHIQSGHNFYLYKQPNGKWIYLSHDFDLDVGVFSYGKYIFSFESFTENINIINILILKDPARFNKILSDIIYKAFNPSTLFSYIDELKTFIRPYVEIDKILDSEGNYPGKMKDKSYDYYTLRQWDAYSEFTTSNFYGLKYWVLTMYRVVCQNYYLKCDSVYMDEGYKYSIDEELEQQYFDSIFNDNDF